MSDAQQAPPDPTFLPPSPPAPADLPQRILDLGVSQIAEVADLARDDPSVIKLWIGEGDLPTPDFVIEAATTALRDGETRYTGSLGLPSLRRALADYHARHWGVSVEPERFAVTTGGMNAIMQAFQATLEAGDEVIHPAPAWPNMVETIRINGGVPVPVPLRDDGDGHYALALEDVFARVGPRTRVIAINSPSNPTGWVMGREQMAELAAFAREHGLWVLSDEVYNHFTYGNAVAPSFLEVCEPDDRLLVTNTFSKNWAMTGWRVGWLAYPRGMEQTFSSLCQYNTTCVPAFIQRGAVAALERGDDFIRSMVGRCAASRTIFVEGLSRIPGVRVHLPEGAFYLMFSVDGAASARELAVRLLRSAKVGLAPGTAFGPSGEGWLRLCFAVSPALAHEAVARLERALRPGGIAAAA